MNHRDTETQRRHRGAEAPAHIAICPQITQITQIRKEDLADTVRSYRGLAAEQSAI